MIACIFFAVTCFGQAQEKVENPNAPEVTFEKMVHDFGKNLLTVISNMSSSSRIPARNR